ncbi:MAG: DoxX family protein [Leifsonia sp.]
MTPVDVQSVLRVILATVFVGMGVLHFRRGPMRMMAAMIPPRLRFQHVLTPRTLVIVTGICEIAGGIGLLVPATMVAAALCLIIFLVAVFPANAYAAHHPERFGRAAIPLVPRLVGQLVLMALIALAII